jgi:hypothetical protein
VAASTSTTQRANNFFATVVATTCGLSIYSISDCPWQATQAMRVIRYDTPSTSKYYRNVTTADIPMASVPMILNESSSLSFLNQTKGYPNWLAVGVYFGIIDFPFNKGSAMLTTEELYAIFDDMKAAIAQLSFGSSPTMSQLLGTHLMLQVIAYHLQTFWISAYSSSATSLLYEEWKSTSTPVVCSILGHTCVWQWGAVSHLSSFTMTTQLMYSLIDRATKVNTNPVSLYYDGNSASVYDSYFYCQNVLLNDEETTCTSTDYEFARDEATVTFPAGLASAIDQINQINSTLVSMNYAKKSSVEKDQLIALGCNISYLLHEVYRNSTTFHDHYVIRYLNKYKYPSYSHNFTLGNWEELGYSQWAGGYVTYALESVFSTYNLVRDGMWYIGRTDYYRTIPEFFSWCILNGHPYLGISNMTESQLLLNALARGDASSVSLLHHIMYRATTLIGDDTFQYTDTWYTGESTYVPEYKKGNFSCEGEAYEPICNILKVSDESSSTECTFISDVIYTTCANRVKKRSHWVTNCDTFQTTITDPINGLACNTVGLFGETHPVISSRGLIIEKMMFSIVIDVIMKANLWCPEYENCQFDQSGLFTTVSVNKLLFEGFTDASYLKYLDLKYSSLASSTSSSSSNTSIAFSCVSDAYDVCGTKNYVCSSDGIKITLLDEELVLNSASLGYSKFFVERLFIYNSSVFLWPYDMNETLATESQLLIEKEPDLIISMINPYYALYPVWNQGDITETTLMTNTSTSGLEFLKHYQCQGRYLYGPPALYNSCVSKINTGKVDLTQVSNLLEYHGNDTLYQYNTPMEVNGSVDEQLSPGLWDSFRLYPYSYQGNRAGTTFNSYMNPVVWNKIHGLRLLMNQEEIENWDKEQRIFPTFQSIFDDNSTSSYFVMTRRFQEAYLSWQPYESTGTPRDSYGMKYQIPIAMSSVERLAGYAVYIGTPHNYGNELWGGAEFLQISGLNPVKQEHRSYLDYDPVTGKMLRRAYRQQVRERERKSFD